MPLCGVFAAAFVAGKPVAEVFACAKLRFSKSNRWQGGLTRHECHCLLRLLGVKWTEVDYMVQRRGCSLAKWVDWHTAKGRTYLVETGGHFQVVRDGIVYDQCGSESVDDFKGKRSHVESALLIKNPKPA